MALGMIIGWSDKHATTEGPEITTRGFGHAPCWKFKKQFKMEQEGEKEH